MSPQMALGPLHLRRRIRIHTQAQTAPTSLACIPFARDSAATIIELGDRAQRVPAEALTTVLSARHAESALLAVSYALGVRDGMLADVRERDSGEDAVSASVLEAAAIGPAVCDGRVGG